MTSPRRFKRAILHIGTERTGSTSTQSAMFRHAAHLATEGVLVPNSLLRPQEIEGGVANHTLFTVAFADVDTYVDDLLPPEATREWTLRPLALQRRLRAALLAEIAAADPAITTLLISSEHLHSRIESPDSVARIADFLREVADAITIVAVIRPQIAMAISVFNLQLRMGSTNTRIVPIFDDATGWDSVLGLRRSYFDLHAMLQRYELAFGRANVSAHLHGDGANFDSSALIFAAAGAALPADWETIRENSSVARAAQELLLFLNRHQHLIAAEARADLRARIDRVLIRRFQGRGLLPARAEAAAFMQQFAAGNEAIRQSYFPDRPTLFALDETRFPEASESLGDQVSREMLVELMGEIIRS